MKFSNQAIALIGILTTIIGYLMLTDFQAIAYDPCTEYSPFHHPEITNNNESLPLSSTHLHTNVTNETDSVPLATLTSLNFSNRDSFGFSTSSIDLNFEIDDYECKQVKKCLCTLTQPCLNIPIKANDLQNGLQPRTFLCSGEVKFCVFLNEHFQNVSNVKNIKIVPKLAKINSVNVLPKDIYFIARNNCNEANISGHQCHWIPSSIITKKECEDCQPICRSVSQTLAFAQFCIAIALMVLSNSLQFAPIVALLTNQSPMHFVVRYVICVQF